MTFAMTTTSSISEKPGRLLILVTSGLAHGRGNLFFPRDAVARECGLVGTILRVHRPCGPGRVVLRRTDNIVILREWWIIVRGTRVQCDGCDTVQLTENDRVAWGLQ